jgi:hypothetical protein
MLVVFAVVTSEREGAGMADALVAPRQAKPTRAATRAVVLACIGVHSSD